MAFENINNGEFEGDSSAGTVFEAFEKVNRNLEKTVEKVPGKDLSSENYTLAEKTKLNNIEEAATRDQTGPEIKSLYEAEPDTNVFSDADKSKLADIEENATADQSGQEIGILYESLDNVNRFTDADRAKLDSITVSGTDGTSQVTITPGLIKGLYESSTNTNAFTDSEKLKLSNIEEGAQVNASPTDLKLDYESNPDTNALTDELLSKLNSIEDNAEANMSGLEIKVAYEGNANTNVLTDARRDKLDNLTIDTSLDDLSSNTVENRAIKIALDTKANAVEVYTISDLQTDPGAGQGDKVHWNNITGAPQFGSETWLTPVATIAERDAIDTSGFSGSEAILVQDSGDGKAAQFIWTGTQWSKIADVDWAAMTDPQIKAAYERNADTNTYTNAEKTKLNAIDLSAIESAVTGDTLKTLTLNGTALEYTTVAGNTGSVSLSNLITTDTNTFVTAGAIASDTLTLTNSDLSTVDIDISAITSTATPAYSADDELAAIALTDVTIPLGGVKTGVPVAAGKWMAFAVNVMAGSTVRVFAQSPGSKAGVAYYFADGTLGAYDESSSLDRQDVTFVPAYTGVYYVCVKDTISTADVSLNIGFSVDVPAVTP